MPPHEWEQLTTILSNVCAVLCTPCQMTLLTLSLLFLARQICLQRREQRYQAIAAMFSEFQNPKFREALRFIYSREPANLILEHLSEEELEQVEMVTVHLQRLGFRARKKLVPEDECYHLFQGMVIRTAQQLQQHLRDQRQKRGTELYRGDYDWLVRRFKLRQLGEKDRRSIDEQMPLSDLLAIEPLPVFR